MTETTRSPEDLEKIVANLARLLLEQMDANRKLIELLTPEGRATLKQIGSLVEKPPTPISRAIQ